MVIVCCGGCNLFQTRDPQPLSQASVGVTPPITPEILLANLQLSIRSHNTDNYMRCFCQHDDTRCTGFYVCPIGGFPGHLQELATGRRATVFSKPRCSDVRQSHFDNLQRRIYQSDLHNDGIHGRLYSVLSASPGRVPTEVRGYMNLYLQTDGQHGWSIYRWEDTRTTTDSTWSYLKAHF